MSWVNDNFIQPSIDIGKGLLGISDAPSEAAGIQAAAGTEAIQFQRQALQQARQDVAPFRRAGALQFETITREGRRIPNLAELVRDPREQAAFIRGNPFFEALADDAQRRLFQNQAARGKVGSGETAKALQNSLLLLGSDLLSQNIGQRMNLATLGANAAAGQATATQQTGRAISDLTTQIGNVQAAGQIGQANQLTNLGNQAFQLLRLG